MVYDDDYDDDDDDDNDDKYHYTHDCWCSSFFVVTNQLKTRLDT